MIERAAAEHGRAIDPEHYGALIPYSDGEVPTAFVEPLAKRRPDLADPTALIPVGLDALCERIEKFVAVGTSKFVVLPLSEPASAEAWVDHLERAAEVLLPLQR